MYKSRFNNYAVATIDDWESLYSERENENICKKCKFFVAETHICEKLSNPGKWLIRTSPIEYACDKFEEKQRTNKQDVCFAYLLVKREKFDDYDQWLDRWNRLQALIAVIADAFKQPKEKIEKILSELDVTGMTCSELAEIIKRGVEDE